MRTFRILLSFLHIGHSGRRLRADWHIRSPSARPRCQSTNSPFAPAMAISGPPDIGPMTTASPITTGWTGAWVLAPEEGFLWTPGYWGWGYGGYFFNDWLLGTDCWLLWRHQLRLRLLRRGVWRRPLGRRALLLQPLREPRDVEHQFTTSTTRRSRSTAAATRQLQRRTRRHRGAPNLATGSRRKRKAYSGRRCSN